MTVGKGIIADKHANSYQNDGERGKTNKLLRLENVGIVTVSMLAFLF